MRAHLRDFVKEDRALVRQFEFSGLRAHCARESALLEAKQLGLEQFARQRRAIHLYEGLLPALRPQMDHPGDDFLAHSAFSADENGHVHRSDLQNLLADFQHLRAGGQERDIFREGLAVFAQRLVLGAQFLLLPALQKRGVEFGFFERLGEVIERAQANCFDHFRRLIRRRKA